MFAKVIVHAATREAAIDRMHAALSDLVVDGVPTTAALHQRILRHPEFASGRYDTRFLERVLDGLLA